MTKALQNVVAAVWNLLKGLKLEELTAVLEEVNNLAKAVALEGDIAKWLAESKVQYSKATKEGQEPVVTAKVEVLLDLMRQGYTIALHTPKPAEVLQDYKEHLQQNAQEEEVPAEVPSIARDEYLRRVILSMPNLPSSFARSPKGHWYEYSGEALDKVITAYKQDRSTLNVSVPKVIAGMLAKAELKNEESGLPFTLNNLPLFATRAEYDTWAKAERAKAKTAEQK